MDSNILKIFDEFEKLDEKHANLIKKIHLLCESGHYDKAQDVTDNEYEPIKQEWLKCQIHWQQALKIINS